VIRREFISLLGGAAAWPLAVRAQPADGRAAALLSRTASSTADTLVQIINDLIGRIGSTVQLSWSEDTMAQRRSDALRLLRQAIPVSEIAFLDASGTERLKVSRFTTDVVGNLADLSQDPKFTQAVAHGVYFAPPYLRRDMIYTTLSVAGVRREAGVGVAVLNLSLEYFVWRARVGAHGVAYILDAEGRFIVHSDMLAPAAGAGDRAVLADPSLFQRDFSSLAQVQAALAAGSGPTEARTARDLNGREVLSASATIEGPAWHVFVELLLAEADTAVP
jgi:hypothetical protein